MTTLKTLQASMNIDEQIENLIEKGLVIDDIEYAKQFLNDVSYFRLIKAYSLNLKAKNGNYLDGVKFQDIVDLYLFNSNLRQALLTYIEKVEIILRCRLSNYFCSSYGVLGYEDINNFSVSVDVFQTFTDEMQKEISRNSKSPFVRNFHENYVDGKIPYYALVELLSFGTLSKFFKNMKNKDKKAVARLFGVGYTYFESWIENFAYVRNICAHYGRLYNTKLAKTPQLYKQYVEKGIKNYRLFATLLSLKHVLPNDKHWNDLVQTIDMLLCKYPSVNTNLIGFPSDWKDYLLDAKTETESIVPEVAINETDANEIFEAESSCTENTDTEAAEAD